MVANHQGGWGKQKEQRSRKGAQGHLGELDHYLVRGGGFTSVYICQNFSNCTLYVQFIVCKLYSIKLFTKKSCLRELHPWAERKRKLRESLQIQIY